MANEGADKQYNVMSQASIHKKMTNEGKSRFLTDWTVLPGDSTFAICSVLLIMFCHVRIGVVVDDEGFVCSPALLLLLSAHGLWHKALYQHDFI